MAAMQLKAGGHWSTAPRHRRQGLVVRAAADNQLLKKPDLKRASPEQRTLFGEGAAGAAPSSTAPGVATGVITIEYQRQRAKEMRQYFVDQRAEKLRGTSQVFGWTPKNEISNGRWVMFGLLVGMLTEYATGVDFIDQLKLMVSYLGIVDLD